MKVFAIAAAVLGIAVSSAAASPQAAKPLIVRGGLGHLVMPGDRAMLGYTVYSGSKAVRGTLYVRNNRQKTYTRIVLTRSNTFRVRVPNRLIRGKRLFYYAAFTDPRSGKSLRLPASGTGTTWIPNKPAVVKLGTHRFGETKAPEAVVARAPADQVGWDITDAFRNGPQTFQVGADGSAWLEDSINNRLLVWNPGHPDQLARSVPVPYGAGISDVVFGPAGSLYVTKVSGDTPARFMLDRLDATTGALIWEAPVAGAYLGGPGGSTGRASRPGMSGGSGGASAVPGSTPSLGLPAPTFRSQDNSSSYGPSRSGPSLGLPEARKASSAATAGRTSRRPPGCDWSAARSTPHTTTWLRTRSATRSSTAATGSCAHGGSSARRR